MDTKEQKRNKAAEKTKKRRHGDHLAHWASHRMDMISPKAPVCQALKEKIKSAIEWSSRRVAERFRDAVLDRPKQQNVRMLKAKVKGDGIHQRADRRVDRRSRLAAPNGPSQHNFSDYKYIFEFLV
uniref:Uncharacterized protein n=1 Tax=Solanum tuberosum TaxID=4113 RepID=M1D8U9_SOLTU